MYKIVRNDQKCSRSYQIKRAPHPRCHAPCDGTGGYVSGEGVLPVWGCRIAEVGQDLERP